MIFKGGVRGRGDWSNGPRVSDAARTLPSVSARDNTQFGWSKRKGGFTQRREEKKDEGAKGCVVALKI